MDEASLANMRLALAVHAQRSGANDEEGVWPENWETVMAFLEVDTQWRTAPVGGAAAFGIGGGMMHPVVPVFIGLDYTASRAGLEAAGVVVTPELWRGLRIMEAAACDALNESNR
jgi:hypothetical protein